MLIVSHQSPNPHRTIAPSTAAPSMARPSGPNRSGIEWPRPTRPMMPVPSVPRVIHVEIAISLGGSLCSEPQEQDAQDQEGDRHADRPQDHAAGISGRAMATVVTCRRRPPLAAVTSAGTIGISQTAVMRSRRWSWHRNMMYGTTTADATASATFKSQDRIRHRDGGMSEEWPTHVHETVDDRGDRHRYGAEKHRLYGVVQDRAHRVAVGDEASDEEREHYRDKDDVKEPECGRDVLEPGGCACHRVRANRRDAGAHADGEPVRRETPESQQWNASCPPFATIVAVRQGATYRNARPASGNSEGRYGRGAVAVAVAVAALRRRSVTRARAAGFGSSPSRSTRWISRVSFRPTIGTKTIAVGMPAPSVVTMRDRTLTPTPWPGPSR